jgi:SAM-dependent methyltransferase
MVSRALMDLWERRGRTFGERSGLLQRAEVIRGVMEESLLFLQCVKGMVLDVGCGDGIPTVSLVQHHQVVGVDFASTMLLRAKSNLLSAGLLRASIDHLPLRSASIPAVTCFFVLSDYYNPTHIVNEFGRVLQAQGRIILADYSSNDDLNNLLDDLQVRILGKGRDMFRLSPEAISALVRRSGLKVKAFKELSYRLTISLDAFINQLYLSSVGPQYRERQLSKDKWRMFLAGWVKGSEIHLTRRFVLVLGENPNSDEKVPSSSAE